MLIIANIKKMNSLHRIIILSTALLIGFAASAQNSSFDVFSPISKYLSAGDVESLSAWLSDNLEISVISSSNDASKNQAKQILKTFFDTYKPRSFRIIHTAGKGNMKYALGTLLAGGESFMVTLFVNFDGNGYTIQQLEIERAQ